MTPDLNEDLHVHSTFSDGRGTLRENVQRASDLGLRRLGCVDHVRRDTPWVPDFVAAVQAMREEYPEVELVCGVETKLLNEAGDLDLPPEAELQGVDRVYVADHRLPYREFCLDLSETRVLMKNDLISESRIHRCLVTSTRRALLELPHGTAVIAHLFSILPKVGLDPRRVPVGMIEDLARVAARRGAWLEIDERWRSPGPRVAHIFREAGVPVLASSDAHRVENIGRYLWMPLAFAHARSMPWAA